MNDEKRTISGWHKAEAALTAITIPLLFYSIYYIFMVATDERMMGAVQRIFYFHVGSAIASYVAFGIVLVCSLAFLGLRERRFDIINEAAAEVAFVFCTITLASGMIWGYSAWNTLFRWEEPRLVSFLLLWLIALSFLLMRHFGDARKLGAHCAVLGILGALTVPLVWISITFVPQSAQLHPRVVDTGGLKHPTFYVGMFVSMGALIALQLKLIAMRARIGFLSERVTDQMESYDG